MLDPIYDDLPDDDELSFLKLEAAYHQECDNAVFDAQRNAPNDYFPAEDYIKYMRQTAAAAEALSLGIANELQVPSAENLSYSDFRDFRGKVDYYRTAIQIRHARRAQGYSVKFDDKTKRIISRHLQQIREIIIKLEIDEWKRESLLTALNNLQAEIDKTRSSYAVLGAFVVEMAGILGAAGEKLEPMRRLIDSVAGLIWGSKHAEQTKKLPPSERKQLPAPKTKQKLPRDMDDEIPF